ncbi:MAG: hypothetical protein E4G98_02180 [Promethearchaeota archaeon]|nr:MAG: hypothetical protein E4G98_02180 [Candidatus Lokiarchaeota archaeon]
MSYSMSQPPAPAPESCTDLLQIKLLFWGPGEAGKTTTYYRLQEIFQRFQVSEGFSISTTDERTLWNDSVHFQFPMIPDTLDVVVNVATTTGQERFLATRDYILQNADGVVFVADSSWGLIEENLRSFEELLHFTKQSTTPIIIQLNKRDLPDAIALADFLLEMDLPDTNHGPMGSQVVFETIAASLEQKEKHAIQRMFIGLLETVVRRNMVDTRRKAHTKHKTGGVK